MQYTIVLVEDEINLNNLIKNFCKLNLNNNNTKKPKRLRGLKLLKK